MDEELELLHERDYTVRVFASPDDVLIARGRVRDLKPAGTYIPDDPDDLVIHQMAVQLEVEYPSLVIRRVDVVFETHPQQMCPAISSAYSALEGVSIARGFTHRVRELFGGPRGCTHVGALLQAMAPAVVQSTWSMRFRAQRRQAGAGAGAGAAPIDDSLQAARLANVDTCHVWASGSELARGLEAGRRPPVMIPLRRRLEALGRDPEAWPTTR